MDRKIIIPAIIILLVGLAVTGIILHYMNEIQPVKTVNETQIAPNVTPEPREPPAEEAIMISISREEAMRIADSAGEGIDPPGKEGKAVDATLFGWRREFWREGIPGDRYHTLMWNVTSRYPEGVLPDGEIYAYIWIDAHTGEVLMN